MRRRRMIPRRRAAKQLAAGHCMFAAFGACSEPPTIVGLRNPYDLDAVLCCERHSENLQRLRANPAEARRLARYLEHRFRVAA